MRLINLYGAENIAACFVEPIAGSTGCLVPPKGYLKRLREICDANGILLVFDEVITGFGRTGPGVRRAELRRHAGPDDDGEGHHQRRAADGRGRDQRAHPRHDHGRVGRRARSSSSTATRTRAIRPRAPRASRRSTSTSATACSSSGRALSPYFLDGLFSLRDVPGRHRHPRLRHDRRDRRADATARRASAAMRCRRSCSTTGCISSPPATRRSSRRR